MKTFSYTLSQKKQKKIKISNTNRDPYLNYPTLISSNYNNLSGVRIREYIELGNVSINFINYFNDFITNTGTQDLSNFFGIEIKSITINLKQLLNNSDNVNINNTELKPFFEEKLMIVNEKYKNNYNFIPSNEIQYIKIMKDVEPFNIDKNYKKSLNSFILSNDDDNSKIDLFKDLLYELNIITNNPINFLKIDDENIFNNLNMDDKKNNLLNSIELHPINFKSMIINEKNNNFNDKDNTYFINFDTELNNSHKMIDDINEKDNDINIIKNYNFKINETTQNNLFDDIIDNENIIDDIYQSDLNINIKRENVNELNFLKTIDNDDSNKKNINKNINFDFNLKLNYNFDKLIFINDTSNENNNINDNYINDTNNNKNDNENIIKENNNFTSSYNFKNNLQYLNINEPSNTNNYSDNYSDNSPSLNNLKINNKLNNKLNMTSINSENIKIYAKENEEKILFSKLNSNIEVNINNFIPKETIDNKNITNNNKNSINNNKNDINNNKNSTNNNKNDDKNEINNVIKENNNFTLSSYNFKNNLQYLNINKPSNTNNYSDDTALLNNLKINNKLNMTSINSENIKIYTKENEEKILFSKLNSNIAVNVNNFIPKETIDIKNIHKIQSDLELNINIDNPDKFNNFLNNSLINTDDVLKEKQKQYILNGLKMTTKYIINVYQLIYNENRLATGLGDFIRGSYFLMEFCKKYNFKYFIDFSNHPVKIFLKKYNKSQLNEKIKNIYKKINKCELDNFNPVIDNNKFINNYSNKQIHFNFLEYLSNQEKNKENIFIYTITFPNEGLINNYKKIMQDILEPTNKINLLVNIKLKILDLKQYSYEVIHIRCGDEYLSDKIINSHQININFILSELNELNPNKKYLLISDNNNIKSFIKKKYNFINILYHDIVHTGEKNEINLKQLENTILDFYLISKSKNVMSYSVYQHGSGFSKWCAFTYDIPYYCKYFGK